MKPASPSRLQLLWYGLPATATGYMMTFMGLYLLKFSTDTLLISPAVMGLLFGLSRIWDAVSDPLVGFLSDRTSSRLGRRRSWMAGGVVPAALLFIMLFSSPIYLSGNDQIIWIGISIFAFYTAMTCILVPHYSLGAEISRDADGRNKLFGTRHAFETVGAILALVAVGWLTVVERNGFAAIRSTAEVLSWLAGAVLAISVIVMVQRTRESESTTESDKTGVDRSSNSDPTYPSGAGVFSAYQNIWRNPHARLIMWVTFIEYNGIAVISATCLYVAQYVMGNIMLGPVIIITYLLASTFSVPLWIRLSRRYGKVKLWLYAMVFTAPSFGAMFTLAFIESPSIQLGLMIVLALASGLASGCSNTIGPSLLSDVIDADELKTGERKEGAYFALWNFAKKGATGVTLMVTGLALSWAGFIPNEEQSRLVELTLCALIGLFPLTCYIAGSILFSRFSLDPHQSTPIATETSP
ncbi:sugar transporter, glycoside-pentoside-hexuronide (GPH):cation symporter family protein [marine gamma proteobacterium HTCC2143]|jgi:GPH family glycoside/pentoside/hexuronide:cation symporter|uniref:Sugar transporter, glycoside-pentoside-hexuronide (GPH):cation symporter family protein n=1 Tax=marine gamma proteobacterium HTCC2143 TaxID=247633 RepID=A0YFW9_9GAMM|nr:sugar transporter, glycoside-pentoside-hexuronide (GPH):cation symporter family protein [marine gamma proteobacterium HTCC2143]